MWAYSEIQMSLKCFCSIHVTFQDLNSAFFPSTETSEMI